MYLNFNIFSRVPRGYSPVPVLRLTTVRKWITDGRVVREEQRDASGGLTTLRVIGAFAAR